MPEISRFYGIIIKMFWNDHNPPHFHVAYGDDRAVIDIQTLGIVGGKLPPRILGMVVEWASIHEIELLEDWDRACQLQPLEKIDPLP